MNTVFADTGFWIALLHTGDRYFVQNLTCIIHELIWADAIRPYSLELRKNG